MPDPIVAPATTSTEAVAAPASIIATSDQPIVGQEETILDTAGAQEKLEQEAESKRLLAAEPATLSPEDFSKREALVKAQEAVKAKALADEKAKGVPEKYEFKLPEGMTLDQAQLDKVTPIFKDAGLTNAQAQKMVDLWFVRMKEESDAKEAEFKTFLDTSAKETMAALGINAKSELAFVAKVKNLLSPETLELLNVSGMGNQKAFIVDMAKIGRLFSEEELVDTGKAVGGKKSPEEILYPDMNK